METISKNAITVETIVNADISKAWKFWNDPAAIVEWCTASEDWHTPTAENDLQVGGQLKSRMEAKDGSMGFDFLGTYTNIIENKLIEYTIADGRKVQVSFEPAGNGVKVTETFEAENTHPEEMQRAGWQAILDNFKKYADNH